VWATWRATRACWIRIAVGGYDPTAIGDDMDLTVRLQKYFRSRREPIRIAFDPNPLGWTRRQKTGGRSAANSIDGGEG
jgi:riboflavin biosynthesis pyrimidine reductase